jgi:hypothetical protein
MFIPPLRRELSGMKKKFCFVIKKNVDKKKVCVKIGANLGPLIKTRAFRTLNGVRGYFYIIRKGGGRKTGTLICDGERKS